jgi:hypothetical protein
LPTGPAAPGAANFKHLTIASDGTIILKDQLRPAGEKGQGAFAVIKGMQAGLKQANSIFVAVDPNTLDILDTIEMPETCTVPHSITTFVSLRRRPPGRGVLRAIVRKEWHAESAHQG